MEEYYLIARNKITNEAKVILIKESWYLPDKSKDNLKRKNSLEALDLVTTKFKSADEMIARMFDNGYIDSRDVDLFIAKKIKKNNKEYIKYFEIIYNPYNKSRIEDLRKIAFSFLKGQKDEEMVLIDKVFNKLISKANNTQEFRDMLTCEMTNVPKRVSSYFWLGKQSYSIKYQNLSSFKNYSTIRNIIEALNRYDYLATIPGDIFNNNINYLNINSSSRKQLEPKLLEILDKDYVLGQYNLEDYFNQEKVVEVKEQIKKDLTLEEKRTEIFRVFRDLSFGFLTFDNNKQKINLIEGKIDDKDKYNLENLLSNKLFKNLVIYTIHKNEYQKNLMYNENTNLLEQEIRQDEKNISNILEKTKNLDKIFLWTTIYKKYINSLEENETIAKKRSFL